VKDADLPVELPDVKKYEPSGTGESPLANIKDWVNVKCPKCGGKAKRETDTMPYWAGSSWYYLRYTDTKNNKVFADKKLLKYWTPVDIYNGGMEHTTLHLLYSRFWHKFLFDEGLVPTSEPYKRRTSHGMVLGEGGIKMSKSRGNVVNPDDVVKEYGADTLRVYEMFMGPFSESIPWEPKSIIGVKRFLDKIWALNDKVQSSKFKSSSNDKILKLLHKTIKGVTEDIENFKFNTAISKLMIFVNEASSNPSLWKREAGRDLIKILSPFAPHLAEELWEKFSGSPPFKGGVRGGGSRPSIFKQPWPKYDEALAKDDEFELVIQVNGKVRDKIMASAGISESDATSLALASEKIKPWLAGKPPRKIIFTGKLISIVI
jgi:leucyl-tRNA synthetase